MRVSLVLADLDVQRSVEMSDHQKILELLEQWAANTRQGNVDAILDHHASDVVIYDVLKPMKYDSAAAYRASWGEWQPETIGGNIFELQDLRVVAGDDVAFAFGFLRCGGTTPAGKRFEDLVRATFCLAKSGGDWRVVHQHISKPM